MFLKREIDIHVCINICNNFANNIYLERTKILIATHDNRHTNTITKGLDTRMIAECNVSVISRINKG